MVDIQLERKTCVKIFVWGVISCFPLLVFISVSILSSLIIGSHSFNGIGTSDNPYEYTYKILEVDLLSNETSVGMVSLSDNLNEDYLYYENEPGNLVLFSRFDGTEEYLCTGSCTCEEGNEFLRKRRSTATILTRGIITLVAAITSLVAYEEAKKYFETECIEKMEESCSMSSITSKVDSCEKMSSESEDGDEVHIRKYRCKGNCLTKKFLKSNTQISADKFRCEKLKYMEEISVDCTNIKKPAHYYREAMSVFQNEIMVPRCKSHGKGLGVYYQKGKKNPVVLTVHYCVGCGSKPLNPTIHCYQTHPPFKKGYSGVATKNMKHWL